MRISAGGFDFATDTYNAAVTIATGMNDLLRVIFSILFVEPAGGSRATVQATLRAQHRRPECQGVCGDVMNYSVAETHHDVFRGPEGRFETSARLDRQDQVRLSTGFGSSELERKIFDGMHEPQRVIAMAVAKCC